MADDITPEIHPNRFYRPKDVEGMLGKRAVAVLRGAGLRAVGDWYLGRVILDCFERACHKRSGQRVPDQKGEVFYGNASEKEVAQGRPNGSIQLVSKRHNAPSIRSQLEAVRGSVRSSEV